MLEIGNTWIWEYNDYSFGPPGAFNQTIEIFEITDTVTFNANAYYELNISRKSSCDIFKTTEYLREANGTLYWLDCSKEMDIPIYNYEATDNFTIAFQPQCHAPIDTIELKAEIISSELYTSINGYDLVQKKIRIEGNNTFEDDHLFTFIEGIGYISHGGTLFPELGIGLCDTYESYNYLRCFINQSTTIKFQDYECFEIRTSTDEPTEKQITVINFPNPSSNKFTLNNQCTLIQIYDIAGTPISYAHEGDQIILLGNYSSMILLDIIDDQKKRKLIKHFTF